MALLDRIVRAGSVAGDIVMDPFMGSGTTAVAAVRIERLFVGFELDAAYLGIAAKRLKEE